MSSTRSQMMCSHCGVPTLHERDPRSVNHILHLLISVFVLGLWIPIWLIMAASAKPRFMRCLACGHSAEEERHNGQLENAAKQQRDWDEYRRQQVLDSRRESAEWWSKVWPRLIAWTLAACVSASRAVQSAISAYNTGLLRLAGGDSFLAGLLWGVIAFGVVAGLGFAVFSTYR